VSADSNMADWAPQRTGRGIAGVLRRRYQTELGLVHRSLFNDSGQVGYGPGRGQLPPAVAGWAVSDRSVRVTVAASVSEVDVAGTLPDAVTAATMGVHVSVRGRHRVTGRAVALAEEEGWARAVFGPHWEAAAFYAGHGTVGSGIWMAHFSLFLGPDRTPVGVPAGWGPPELQPLTRPLHQMAAR